MNITIHQRIRILLEETNDAFACYDTVNADFADFAALSLPEFKNVLGDPDLTEEQLTNILRRGMAKHQDKDPHAWSVFMAYHIARAANRNSRLVLAAEWSGEARQTA
ncbi:MAG: hypothetical protein IT558_02445 [Alphaproteobacteria bacterium]|nr:hypothetical protein [Alphaproteobacteria bacterium]